ncbi:hypothetical protein Bbelb_029810 [Branchiostoma belcheri]|nr:hypothetical protein Bbelb_029810 [Branchiostoma belcheri]
MCRLVVYVTNVPALRSKPGDSVYLSLSNSWTWVESQQGTNFPGSKESSQLEQLSKALLQDIVREAAGYLPGACRRPTNKGDKMPLKETLIVTTTTGARQAPEPGGSRPGLHPRRAPA